MTTPGKRSLLCLLAVCLAVPCTAATTFAIQPETVLYQLAISFNTHQHLLTGTARINLPANAEQLTLELSTLNITGILLKNQDGSAREVTIPEEHKLHIPKSDTRRDLYISYNKKITEDGNNLITASAITLLDNWHPQPDKKVHFQLTATLPAGFNAITESDLFPLTRSGNNVSATFREPLYNMHFAAAAYSMTNLEVRENLTVYALFFAEDRQLAADYLAAARSYLLRYEDEIGPYPYNHYVIAANRLPTGLGMPTFTLLGQAVLRLPFIKDTSLGHEILHSWFGNSVDVDYSGGNWCEGLTAYLADHAFLVDKGEGTQYRKESILNYLSYINTSNVLSLATFISADHSQAMARARRAVGYSRGALLFHELREKIGHPAFLAAIRNFYRTNKGRTVSWTELEQAFTAASGQDLVLFFKERLHRADIPSLAVDDINLIPQQDSTILAFTLKQETEQPYTLQVPIRVTTGQGDFDFVHHLSSQSTEIRLPLPSRPLQFVLDPDYSLLRQLDSEETPATWSRFLGSTKKLVILESKEAKKLYAPLLSSLQEENWTITYDDEVTNAQLGAADLLFLGIHQHSSRSLFALPPHADQGFTLDVRINPLNDSHVAVLISSSSQEETAAVAYRLPHYGKYSYLYFNGGRITDKKRATTASGQIYTLEELPLGGSTAPLATFPAIIKQLSTQDVVYIGETHTSVADHLLQLRILEALSGQKSKLAIGMEMFPAGSQNALDSYVLGDSSMAEKQFLKDSRYFQVWRYDYRYFREIFHLARQKKIPVIGLNTQRDTVSTVFRTGGTDALPAAARNQLPKERDLNMPGYTDRLQAMHDVHVQGSHGSGMQGGFIQAQAIWDETMAENIANFLQEHPDHTMVVLAGTQHTRKDSGIPPRVSRRIQVQQSSVLNITNGSVPENLPSVADFFFITAPASLPEPAKMGIVLEERERAGTTFLEIIEFSPHGKAQAAGLRAGDILQALDGYPVHDMTDIRIAMVDAQAGDTATVQISRGTTSGKLTTLTFELKLVTLPRQQPHP